MAQIETFGRIHLTCLNAGNELYENMVEEYQFGSYSDEQLLEGVVLTPDFQSSEVVTFKISDGNHRCEAYIRRHGLNGNDTILFPISCFDCSRRIIRKYEEKCLCI